MADATPTSPKKRVRGAARSTREDWIQAGLEILIEEGADSVKIASLATRLDCARSSFYWYFKDRKDLLSALLDHWQERNTRSIVTHAAQGAPTINMALINVYSCYDK